MKKTGPHSINNEACTGCGECIRVCPDKVIALVEKKAVFSGESCLDCGHCAAVCPVQAIHFKTLSCKMHFQTFAEKREWLPFGGSDITNLVQLMRSRRSCRNYMDKTVSREILCDLVKIGTTAPSGTNSQGWTFTILENRRQVVVFGGFVASFFKALNRKAANPFLRIMAGIFLKDNLGRYYRSYYKTIETGLHEWDSKGKDLLFHGATAAILVGGTPKASCPAEDALLATQNILLAAHAMGLGSCLIGFAVEAMKHDPSIKKRLSISGDESIYAVIALGYPAEKYQFVTGRKVIQPRMVTL